MRAVLSQRQGSQYQQRGVALLLVLVVVVIIATLMYPLWQAQRSALIRAQASQAQLQAWAVLLSAQDWVKGALLFDSEQSTVDSLQELWAQPMSSVAFDGGYVSGRLVDAQSKLNINELATPDVGKRDRALAKFERLCQVLTLNCPFWSVVADWITTGQTPLNEGVELNHDPYQQPKPSLSNQPLLSVQALSQVVGVDAVTLQVLSPYLVALPESVAVNINTASTPVLMATIPTLTADVAQQWVVRQHQQPFQNMAELRVWLTQLGMDGQAIEPWLSDDQLTVATHYFLLSTQAVYNQRQWQMDSLLQRKAGRVHILARWLAEVN